MLTNLAADIEVIVDRSPPQSLKTRYAILVFGGNIGLLVTYISWIAKLGGMMQVAHFYFKELHVKNFYVPTLQIAYIQSTVTQLSTSFSKMLRLNSILGILPVKYC